MKSLYESILDDEEIILDKKLAPDTLFDCIKDHIINFSFKRSLGPTHYYNIPEVGRQIKKDFKADILLSKTGKKGDPALLSSIFANAASQVEIDWSLDAKERLEKARVDVNNIISKYFKGMETKNGHINIWFDIDPVITRYGNRKTYVKRNGMGMSIEVNYNSGTQKINVDTECPLFLQVK